MSCWKYSCQPGERLCRILLPLIACLVLSCAQTLFYTEPALGESEAAIVEAYVPVWIISLDGQRVRYDMKGDAKSVKVPPGPRVVEVSYAAMEVKMKNDPSEAVYSPPGLPYIDRKRVYGMSYLKLNIDAKPGHTYSITGRTAGKKWFASVNDFLTINPR